MKHVDVIEKIKKLLALAQSSNQHESELAMARVTEMVKRYNISLRDIEGNDRDFSKNSQKFFETTIELEPGTISLEIMIATILKNHFFVSVMHDEKEGKVQFIIVGEHHNVEIAYYVFLALERKFQDLWIDYKNKNNLDELSLGSYLLGLFYGLNSKLDSQKAKFESNKALLAVKSELEAHVKKCVGDNASVGIPEEEQMRYISQIIRDGKVEGRKIEILPGIRSSKKPA